ncbi:MAG TPA: trypsin-like peptidase domain-containing protein, partial [Gammaproteobacteria bacterium]|nr:trypsin-like peptidase domain-containing protein [Gammaproteobacteria bacterium]
MYHFSFSLKRCIITLILSLTFIALPAVSYNLPDFSKLVEKSSPAVVSILTFDSTKATQQLIPDDLRDDIENTPLMDMLREMYGEQVEEKLYGKEGQPGLGSGSLISEDGYIITNYHVVNGATKIYVQLKDRSQFQAHVIGFDPGTDLALLKIDGDNLPYLKFSNEPVKVGQWVVAIGAPFGFEDTLTVGVVSAKQRSLGQE